MNDREEHIAGHEDSEYHFSDDDVSYEVESEAAAKPAAPTVDKENMVKRFTNSKRMIISLGIFFVLMFIVYKMVSSPTIPPTEIVPVPAQPQMAATTPTMDKKPNVPGQANPPAPSAQLPAPSPTPNTQVAINPAPSAMNMQPQPPVPQQVAMPQMQSPSANAVPAMQQALPQQAMVQPNQQPIPAQMVPQQQMMQPVAGLPNVMPVVNPTAGYVANIPTQITGQQNAAMLSVQNDKLLSQMQAEYQQRINEYAAQNKAMQDQMQVLANRVAGMENQLGQIYQAVNQPKAASQAPAAQPAARATQKAEPVKIPYNVQAIIPGRAWLKADNGDTVTVTEGDILKDVGRISKIDPYDGIVEVNTGNTVVSLSYGSGG